MAFEVNVPCSFLVWPNPLFRKQQKRFMPVHLHAHLCDNSTYSIHPSSLISSSTQCHHHHLLLHPALISDPRQVSNKQIAVALHRVTPTLRPSPPTRDTILSPVLPPLHQSNKYPRLSLRPMASSLISPFVYPPLHQSNHSTPINLETQWILTNKKPRQLQSRTRILLALLHNANPASAN